MSDKRPDIAQISKYLKGELDARNMHELEMAAQNDPFLADALDGFERAGANRDTDLGELKDRLAERIAPKKQRSILLWRALPIAACLLLMLGAGYWFFSPRPGKPRYANAIPPDDTTKNTGGKLPMQITVTAPAAKHDSEAKTTPGPVTKNVVSVQSKATASEGLAVGARHRDIPELSDTLLKRSKMANAVQDNPVDNVEQLLQGKVAGQAVKKNYGALPARGSIRLLNVDSGQLAAKTGPINGMVTLSGVVSEAASGEPLTGTTVGTPGNAITQADVQGRYRVTVPNGAVVVFNEIGYATQSIKLKPGQQTLNVKLSPNNLALDEVVIRGYVKRNREETTGSSYIITGKEVQNNPVGNVEQLVQGKVAGLNIQNGKTAPVPATAKPCKEDTIFKDKFFASIAAAERYNFEHAGGYVAIISDRQFRKALKFIARYSPVSVDKNSDLEAFRADKEQWLKWYEANKCNGIK